MLRGERSLVLGGSEAQVPVKEEEKESQEEEEVKAEFNTILKKAPSEFFPAWLLLQSYPSTYCVEPRIMGF